MNQVLKNMDFTVSEGHEYPLVHHNMCKIGTPFPMHHSFIHSFIHNSFFITQNLVFLEPKKLKPKPLL
jgi:hypothetical protein